MHNHFVGRVANLDIAECLSPTLVAIVIECVASQGIAIACNYERAVVEFRSGGFGVVNAIGCVNYAVGIDNLRFGGEYGYVGVGIVVKVVGENLHSVGLRMACEMHVVTEDSLFRCGVIFAFE